MGTNELNLKPSLEIIRLGEHDIVGISVPEEDELPGIPMM